MWVSALGIELSCTRRMASQPCTGKGTGSRGYALPCAGRASACCCGLYEGHGQHDGLGEKAVRSELVAAAPGGRAPSCVDPDRHLPPSEPAAAAEHSVGPCWLLAQSLGQPGHQLGCRSSSMNMWCARNRIVDRHKPAWHHLTAADPSCHCSQSSVRSHKALALTSYLSRSRCGRQCSGWATGSSAALASQPGVETCIQPFQCRAWRLLGRRTKAHAQECEFDNQRVCRGFAPGLTVHLPSAAEPWAGEAGKVRLRVS